MSARFLLLEVSEALEAAKVFVQARLRILQIDQTSLF
jgi:hypothetical protein